MDNQYIAVMDSGIGGISVLTELVKYFPNQNFLYFGDNDNAPYGNRSKQDLLNLTIHNIDTLKLYPIKAIVLACNTLSVNLIKQISEYSNLKTFGIFPPVESCEVMGKKTVLLATQRTCLNYKDSALFKTVGFYDLAKKIEDNIFNPNKINILSCAYKSELCLANKKKGEFYNLIIGCTHYNFIKNEIIDHFQPQKVFDGTKNLILQMNKYFKNKKTLVNSYQKQILFVGKNAKINEKIFKNCGQTVLKNDIFIQKN